MIITMMVVRMCMLLHMRETIKKSANHRSHDFVVFDFLSWIERLECFFQFFKLVMNFC
jgi:hypothetical protein